MRRLIGVSAAAVAVAFTLAGGPAQANPIAEERVPATVAAAENGRCEAGEVCLYYNSNCKGSLIDFPYAIRDFAGYVFLSDGNGEGDPVKNNAASARNLDPRYTARIWFNSGWQGTYDNVSPNGNCRNLVNTYNENASLSWYL